MIRDLLLSVCLSAWLFVAAVPSGAAVHTVESVPHVQRADRTRYVSNPDGILSAAAVARIDAVCDSLRVNGIAQVAVVALDGVEGGDVFDFAYRLFSAWGVGRSGDDNGLGILLVRDAREVRFVTGRGLEGVLPDALCKRIQLDRMLPRFREGDYDAGMVAGVEAVRAVLTGSELDRGLRDGPAADDAARWTGLLIVAAMLLGGLLIAAARTRCPRCGRRFALRTVDRKRLRGVNGTVVEERCVCKYCGYEETRRSRRDDDDFHAGRRLRRGIWLGGMGGGFGPSGGGSFGGGFGGGSFGGGGAGSKW